MPEPFKNLFNAEIIAGMGDHFAKAWPDFDSAAFIATATEDLESLELKERSDRIRTAMEQHLPEDFAAAAEIMLASLAPEHEGDLAGALVDAQGIAGWAVMPMTHYVGLQGQGHFDLSMTLLKEMTKRFSSEFGIRFFLLETPERTLSHLASWTDDPSRHVRRLVSEGTRPRLPWAMRLPAFIADPSPLLPLLEALKDDPEDYVRRSVANNLNDIAKDHPDLVARIAGKWLKDASRERERLIRHACRSLIKQGHPETLKALGYGAPSVELAKLDVATPRVAFGDALVFDLALVSKAKSDQPLIIDYVIHHRKANGGTSPKVFKWKNLTLAAGGAFTGRRRHPMRQITTRVYYPGRHRLEVLVNGQSVGGADFELAM